MNRQPVVAHFSIFVLALLVLAPACSATQPESLDCTSASIKPAPTATRSDDPDLSKVPEFASGGNLGTFCPTPIPNTMPILSHPNAFEATELVNLSLHSDDQEIEATAVGDDMLAIAWRTDGDIYIALSRGGNHFQVRRVDSGENVSLTFSTINRLHVAYEQEGQILYRAADQGIHPADVDAELVTHGTNPTVLLNQFNYAQIVFEIEGVFHHAAQFMHESWQIGRIDGAHLGSDARFTSFGSDLELGYLIAYGGVGGDIHLARWQTTPYGFFPAWQPLETRSVPSGETIHNQVTVDSLQDESWAVATWTTVRPTSAPSTPAFTQPVFEPVNPLYPNHIADPHHLHAGLNAVRWTNDLRQQQPYSAGLYQTVSVASGTPIQFSAWGIGDSNMRLGIDPSGGTDANSDHILWSANHIPDTFTEFTVNGIANGAQITVFLEGTFSEPDATSLTVWDNAQLHNGSLVNASFEKTFSTQNGQSIPDGWTAYFEDGSFAPATAETVYTVYTSWSSDKGTSWTTPIEVVQNRDASGSLSGAIPSNVFPLISAETDPPTVSFVYLYAAGNPPSGTNFIRFGRPYIAQCTLISADCTSSPGEPLLERSATRPASQLVAARDALDPSRATLVWTARQSDTHTHDIFATQLVLR